MQKKKTSNNKLLEQKPRKLGLSQKEGPHFDLGDWILIFFSFSFSYVDFLVMPSGKASLSQKEGPHFNLGDWILIFFSFSFSYVDFLVYRFLVKKSWLRH